MQDSVFMLHSNCCGCKHFSIVESVNREGELDIVCAECGSVVAHSHRFDFDWVKSEDVDVKAID